MRGPAIAGPLFRDSLWDTPSALARRWSAGRRAGFGLPARVKRFVNLVPRQPRFLIRQLPYGAAGEVRLLGDLGSLVIPDEGGEGGGHADRAFDVAFRPVAVGFDAGERLVDEDEARRVQRLGLGPLRRPFRRIAFTGAQDFF